MTENTIITIGRQFGSGGHKIGNKLSEKLNIPLYDYNLIRMAARELNVTDEAAKQVDETILGRVLSAYVVGTGDYTAFMTDDVYGVPLSDRMYAAQTEIIKKLADRGPCIFVGRCADYVLGDYSNMINTFIYAYKDDRINRIKKLYDLNDNPAWDKIKKVDQERKLYYEAHTGREWGTIESHEILINASLTGIDGAVDILEALFKKKQELAKK